MTFRPVCKRHGYRRAVHDRRRRPFDGQAVGPSDCASAVERPADRIDDLSNQGVADDDVHNAAGAPHFIAGAELIVIAEQHDANLVFIDIEGDAKDPAGKAKQFLGTGAGQARHFGDADRDIGDSAYFVRR